VVPKRLGESLQTETTEYRPCLHYSLVCIESSTPPVAPPLTSVCRVWPHANDCNQSHDHDAAAVQRQAAARTPAAAAAAAVRAPLGCPPSQHSTMQQLRSSKWQSVERLISAAAVTARCARGIYADTVCHGFARTRWQLPTPQQQQQQRTP
jgi:hypothetical protein